MIYLPTTPDPAASCPLCLDFFYESTHPVVAHQGEGFKHPIHLECVKEWLLKNPSCPSCRCPIQIDSTEFLSQRTFIVDQRRLSYKSCKIAFTILFGSALGLSSGAYLSQFTSYGMILGEALGLGIAGTLAARFSN